MLNDTSFEPNLKTMKKILLLFVALFSVVLTFAQEVPEQTGKKKTVTITKTWTDENGQERTITVIKEAEDTPENADWLGSEDVTAPENADIDIAEQFGTEDADDSAFPWKDLPGELRFRFDELTQEFQENWPEIEGQIRKGKNEFFYEDGRPFFRQGFLGVVTEPSEQGVRVLEVVSESAAEEAELQVGDILLQVDEEAIDSPAELAEAIRSYKPGNEAVLKLIRGDQEMTLPVVLGHRTPQSMNWKEFSFQDGKDSRAPHQCTPKAQLGVMVNDQEKGVHVLEVFPESGADAAGIREGDIIYQIDKTDIQDSKELIDLIGSHKPGDQIQVSILREGVRKNVKVTLGSRNQMSCCPPGCCQGREKGGSADERSDVETLEEINQGIATLELKDLRIFPNPTSDEVQVAFRTSSEAPIQVRILDASGRAFQVVELSGTDTFNETFRLGDQPAGNYTLFIEQDGQFLTRTIIRNE